MNIKIMHYYNIELAKAAAEKLQRLLYTLGINHEISAAGSYYHFEILTNEEGAAIINNFLDTNMV